MPLSWSIDTTKSGATIEELYSNGSTMELYRYWEQWCHYQGTI